MVTRIFQISLDYDKIGYVGERMKHKLLKLLLITFVIALICAITIFYAMYIAPENIKITHKSIQSDKIGETLDDVNIAFISDFHYGEFVDQERFGKMIDTIHNASADIVLFGGDLFTNPDAFLADNETKQFLIEKLKSIKAPLGKFFVLGECDLKSEDAKNMTKDILYQAGFEDLTNKNIKIYNGSSDNFVLVGLDSYIGGTNDIQSAYTNISEQSFVVSFSHAPDIYALIPDGSSDLAFAGHSHGGQISLPIIGPLNSIEGAAKFEKGTYQIKNLTIAISNGLGTSDIDMRLFSSPEVLMYRLSKKN